MEDEEILALYRARDERALCATAEKYRNYCLSVAINILGNAEDGAECVNDTWLRAWNAIPPHQPRDLSTFLAKITRNLAFSRWRQTHAQKRGNGELSLALEELEDCIPCPGSVESELDRKELAAALDTFLAGLSRGERRLFLRRYWFATPVKTLAKEAGKSETAVSHALGRTRMKLKTYLTERGFMP